jgi:hypothetical protein
MATRLVNAIAVLLRITPDALLLARVTRRPALLLVVSRLAGQAFSDRTTVLRDRLIHLLCNIHI